MDKLFPCVSVESPFAAPDTETILKHIAYARECLAHAITQGEAPFLSHLMYTQVLNDNNPDHRIAGLAMSHCWRLRADKIVFYTDLGMSPGMKDAEALAKTHNIPTEYRRLYNG